MKNRIKSFFCWLISVALLITGVPFFTTQATAATASLQFNADGKFRVMQVTDIQSDQNVNSRIISVLTAAIARYNPDLVVFTGDNIKGSISAANFRTSVDKFLAPIINSNTKFAVTFGNHDAESSIIGNPGSKTEQYEYYATKGGNLFINHDVVELTGVGNGVIPIYPHGQTGGTPAYQIYLMDSNDTPSAGSYDCPYTDQIDYYVQRSLQYPDVPSLWFMHIIVPDIYDLMIKDNNGKKGGALPYSLDKWALNPSYINWERSSSNVYDDIFREGPCPANFNIYTSAAHRSSSSYGSKTLYEAWRDYGNMKGAYFGHDHLNEFTLTTPDGIDLGYGDSTGLVFGYKDDDPGVSIYELNIDGSYTNEFSAESDLAKVMISFDANGGTGTMKSQLVNKYAMVNLNLNTGITKPGYHFIGWNTKADGTGLFVEDGGTVNSGSADFTLYAVWQKRTEITFDANGGTGGYGPVSLVAGASLTPPEVTKTGYTFTGWSPHVPPVVPDTNTVYVAQWSINSYTMTFDANGGEGGISQTLEYNSSLTAPIVTREGYTFAGWQPSVPERVPAQDSTYTAIWNINSYTAVFDPDGGTGGGSFLVNFGEPLEAPTVNKENYTFVGWEPVVPPTMPARNMTFTAKWNANTFNVVFDAAGGDGGCELQVPYNSTLTLPTVTRYGYEFVGWYPQVPEFMPAEELYFTAVWEPVMFAYTFDPGGGTGGRSGMFYLWDSLEDCAPVVTRPGYTFVGWEPEIPDPPPAHQVYFTAQWVANDYLITFDANGGEGGYSTVMKCGSELIAPTLVRTGYTFVGWEPAVPPTVPGEDTTFVAQWAVIRYRITFDANGGEGGTVEFLRQGTPIVPPVVTRAGHEFLEWTPDVDDYVGTTDLTYTALWKPLPPSIIPRENSTTVIDYQESYIYGLRSGLTKTAFEKNFVLVSGYGRLEYETASGLLGTGSKVNFIDNSTNEILQSFTVIIYGDVNGDGNIDDGDGAQITDYEFGYYSWGADSEKYLAGDLNGDGCLDAMDSSIVTDVLNYMLCIDQTTGSAYPY